MLRARLRPAIVQHAIVPARCDAGDAAAVKSSGGGPRRRSRRDIRAPEDELDRFLAAQSGRYPREAAFLLERRADGGRRAAGPLGVPRHFALDLVVADLDVLATD